MPDKTFLDTLPPHGPERNAAVLAAIQAGQIDPPTWVPVTAGAVTLWVSADYLTIDGARIPMTASNAQAAVDTLDALLPTPTIVDAIEVAARATGRLVPFDAWARWHDDSQLETSTILWRERNIARRLAENPPPPGTLLAGHLKDTVIAPFMPAGKVVIYGARYPRDARVQPVYSGHGDWFDQGYAGGVRAVRRQCTLHGAPALLDDLLQKGVLGGPVARLRYPPSPERPTPVPQPRPTPTVSAVLRRGHTGPAVIELQTLLSGAGFPTRVDGAFGADTERAVRAFQAAHPPLEVDGLAGPKTLTVLRSVGDTDRPPAPLPVMPLDAARALGVKEPLSEAEIDALYGPIEWSPIAGDPSAILVPASWKRANLVAVKIPQLIGVKDAPRSGLVQVHKRIAEPFRAMFDAWEKRKKLGLIVNWGGTVADRRVRNGTLVSRHARGIAWDFNTQPNWRGTPGAARGTYGSVVELFEEYVEYGFASGGFYPIADWMHGEGAG